jgi:phosphatidylinositol alpha-1,6-mannosyltransferase
VREGGIPESVVHECTGLLAERNTKDFAAAIQLLLDDPLLAETYGRNGREYVVRNWTWEKSVTALETQLSRCAGAAA